jgi:NADPH2:quinone reductase
VNWVDVLMTSGQYQHVPDPPYTPGLEYAGEVVRSDRLAVGTAVLADGLLTGPRSLGAHRRWGGFATFALAPVSALLPLPDGLSFDEGACFLGSAETAWHALVVRARVQAGETVLVLGATGSTGLAAVRLGAWLGARVIALGRSPEKLEIARGLGAERVVTDLDALQEKVDVVFDAVGGELSVRALRACAFGARFVIVGWAGTPLVGRDGVAPNVLPTNLVLMKQIDVLGSPAAIAAHRDPAMRAERRARVLACADALRPHVGAVFAFEDLGDALRAKWEGRVAGNVVVRPPPA